MLLADPNGMMRWYISVEFIDRKEERTMLLQAWEMRALVILVDGVDEAAGLRDIVEAFVHYELVPSGNRLVVTSRPEGVDLDDYKTRFVVMNLLELTQEQQRNVIQMQLQGNAFFEHLVNIAECRKMMDAKYRSAFNRSRMRNEIEVVASPSSPPSRPLLERKASRRGGGAGRRGGGGGRPGGCPRGAQDERAAREGAPRRGERTVGAEGVGGDCRRSRSWQRGEQRRGSWQWFSR